MRADARCRSCGQPIRWVLTENHKRMPLNSLATPDGNIWTIGYDGPTPIVKVAAKPEDVPVAEAIRYTSHHATCPDADQWRTRDRART